MSSVQTTATWTRPASVSPEIHVLIGQLIGWGLLGSLCFGAGLLAYRRLAGALIQPLEAPWLAAVGLGVWLLAFLARWTTWPLISTEPLPPLGESGGCQPKDNLSAPFEDQRIGRQTGGQTSPRGWLNWLTKGCMVGIAICLTVPGVSAVGLLGLWGTVLGGWAIEAWFRGRLHPALLPGKRLWTFFPNKAPSVPDFRGSARRWSPAQPDLEHWPEGLLEHLIRARTPEGGEVQSGWVRVDFLPGQRTAIVHIAFCPPFAHKPSLYLEQAGGALVRLKPTHVYPYGFRIEVKREQIGLERAAWVLLEFQAQCPAASEGPPPASSKPSSL